MKTFDQWFESFNESFRLKNYAHDSYIAKSAWSACDAEWKSFIEKDYGVLSFEEFWGEMEEENGHIKSPASRFSKKAWVRVESAWRHKIANIETAHQLKVDILEKQIAEMRKDLNAVTVRPSPFAETNSLYKEIRQRHKLDEVKS